LWVNVYLISSDYAEEIAQEAQAPGTDAKIIS
jgi:hypothetical protein